MEKLEKMAKNEGREGREKARKAYRLQRSLHNAIHEIKEETKEKEPNMDYLLEEAMEIIEKAKLISVLTPAQVLLGLTAFDGDANVEISGYEQRPVVYP